MEAIARKKETRAAVRTPVVEFTAAAHEHVEGPFLDTTIVPSTSQQTVNPVDIPAYGFMRHIVLHVTTSGGTIGTPTLDDDFPWNLFDEIALLDVNGAPIVQLSGFDLFLANLFGGYGFISDLRVAPDYSESTAISFQLLIRVPVEINHNNGLGALSNQNAAAPYRLRITVAPTTTIYDTAPTTAPSCRIRAYLEAWSMPDRADLLGRQQAQLPPRHGTTQYWSSVKNVSVSAGAQTLRINRVGNLIRNIIFVGKSSGDRSASVLPDPATLKWDGKELYREPVALRRLYMAERNIIVDRTTTGVPAVPVGVLAYQFTHDVLGHAGDGTAELYLPTLQSSRLELEGTFGAGTVDILINDVAPVEVDPDERYVFDNDTGFAPEVGVSVRR